MSVKDLKGFEPEGVEFDEFEGQKKVIEKVEMIDVKSDYDESGKYVKNLQRDVKVLKVESEVVTTLENREGEEIEIRASELFNLKLKEDVWGWSKSKKGGLKKFLAKIKVDSPNELEGKTVTLRVRSKEMEDGTTREFLGFIRE